MDSAFTNTVADLCMRMGIALTTWQNVEEQHYHLFLGFLRVQEGPIPSVVYFSVESFDARRIMVARMADYFLSTTELKTEWGEINKQLKDQNINRNSIAHYGIYWNVYQEQIGDSVEIRIKPPSLQPSLYNRVSVLLGRSTDPTHNLSAESLDTCIREFSGLAERISNFRVAISRSPASLSPLPMPPPPTPMISPPPPLNKNAQGS